MLTLNSTFPVGSIPLGYGSSYSADGTFITLGGPYIYKRTGDVYSLFYTVPTGHTLSGYTMSSLLGVKISLNGNRIIVVYRAYNGASYFPAVISNLYNGTTFAQEAVSFMSSNVTSTYGFDITPDGSFFALISNNYTGIYYGFINGSTFTVTPNVFGIANNSVYGISPTSLCLSINRSGNALWYVYNDMYNPYIAKLTINSVNKTLSTSGINILVASNPIICGIHPVSDDAFIYIPNTAVFFLVSSTSGAIYYISRPQHSFAMRFNADGTRMVGMDMYNNTGYSIGYYSVSGTGASTTFSLITSYTDSTSMAARAGVGIVPA